MRPGIGEEEVRFAAEALKAAGRSVSIIAVREKLGGRGSYSTIKRHLDSWIHSVPREQGAAPELPPELLSSQTEALAVLWQSAIQSAKELLADELAKQAQLDAEKERALADAADEIARLEKGIADNDEIEREREIAKRRLEDEIVELRTELTATKTQALELKASLESSAEREQKAKERSEANAALLADARTQLNQLRAGIESISMEKTELESKCLKLDTQITAHQKELALAHQREDYAVLEIARLNERCIALESELQTKAQELSNTLKSIDEIREGEKDLKEAVAQGQATERELRARLSFDADRLSKMENSLERLFEQIKSDKDQLRS